jgi:hypothetical protein
MTIVKTDIATGFDVLERDSKVGCATRVCVRRAAQMRHSGDWRSQGRSDVCYRSAVNGAQLKLAATNSKAEAKVSSTEGA